MKFRLNCTHGPGVIAETLDQAKNFLDLARRYGECDNVHIQVRVGDVWIHQDLLDIASTGPFRSMPRPDRIVWASPPPAPMWSTARDIKRQPPPLSPQVTERIKAAVRNSLLFTDVYAGPGGGRDQDVSPYLTVTAVVSVPGRTWTEDRVGDLEPTEALDLLNIGDVQFVTVDKGVTKKAAKRGAEPAWPFPYAKPAKPTADGHNLPGVSVAGVDARLYFNGRGELVLSVNSDDAASWLTRTDKTLPLRVVINEAVVHDDTDAAREPVESPADTRRFVKMFNDPAFDTDSVAALTPDTDPQSFWVNLQAIVEYARDSGVIHLGADVDTFDLILDGTDADAHGAIRITLVNGVRLLTDFHSLTDLADDTSGLEAVADALSCLHYAADREVDRYRRALTQTGSNA